MQYEGELDIDDVIEFTIPVKAMQAGEVKNQASIMYFDTPMFIRSGRRRI